MGKPSPSIMANIIKELNRKVYCPKCKARKNLIGYPMIRWWRCPNKCDEIVRYAS